MTASALCLALAGWALAALYGTRSALLRRRLDRVADAEHELRGPLLAVNLALERFRRLPGGPLLVGAVESELARATAGLADLTAARTGRPRPAGAEVIALEPLARSSARAWAPLARTRGGSVSLDWRAGPARVRSDRGRLAQALGNLLSNAAEHGSGPVEVRARRRGAAVRLEVVNDRPAEAPARRPDPERGRGLRIASRAAEDAGGSVELSAAGRRLAAVLELPAE